MMEFLNSKIGLLLVGGFLTAIFGSLFAAVTQHLVWRRQSRFELFKKNHDETTNLLNDILQLIDRRLFWLHRYILHLDSQDKDKLEEIARENDKIVVEWNCLLRTNHSKLRLLFGEDIAAAFLDYNDNPFGSEIKQKPDSLHFRIVKLQRMVSRRKTEVVDRDQAMQEMNIIYHAFSVFAWRITAELSDRGNNVQSFKLKRNLHTADRTHSRLSLWMLEDTQLCEAFSYEAFPPPRQAAVTTVEGIVANERLHDETNLSYPRAALPHAQTTAHQETGQVNLRK